MKIDQSFVRDITNDPDDAAIVGAIITMTHAMGIKAVAEGVETRAQFELLTAQHCDFLQGYYLSKPLPADKVESLFKHRRSFG